ncbi:MAG: DUF4197 domain-containing protein [Desulfobacteraceae bacterium]|nr:MAG: DUF4197 domain-containing protein [Desulfobacteraceae bacterium]
MSITAAGMLFIALCSSSVSAEAAESWWEKGSGILRSLEESSTDTNISVEEIGAGLKDALRVSSENVVKQLGREDGFNKDPDIHIPLPQQLDTVKSLLAKVGMSGMLDDLELKLNRAAEQAAPKAKNLFWKAIKEMSFDDAKKIYGGPEDAATQYFRGKMSSSLSAEMQPVVKNSLAEVGAVRAYDNAMTQYRSIPFVPEVKADITDYVLEKGVDGIFHYMAIEEAAIRRNPAKRTTDLLKLLFGAK